MDIVTGTNNQSAAPGATLPTDPAVLIRDSGGNPVAGVEVTFSTGGDASVSPGVVSTDGNGIAATNWTLGSAAGDYELTATSSVGSVTFDATATAFATTTTLTALPAPPATSGTNVTFTANVASTGGTPTGTVEFRDAGNLIDSRTLASGVATLDIVLDVGSHSITANYLTDGTFASSSSDPFSYEVTASNAAPTVGADAFSAEEDATLSQPAPGVLANDADPDEDNLTAEVVSPPTNGDLALGSDGSFTYSPDDDYNGSDQFTYRANDGDATSAVATVAITVDPVNDDPSFTPGGNIEVNIVEAVGFTTQWATGVDPGPPDESDQELDFQVTLDNSADSDAFLVPPQISDDGTLTFSANLLLTEPRVIPLTVVLADEQGGTTDPWAVTITLTPALGG
jgi:VCBS repeat-containing protein